jgi:hypothetical protein
MKTIGIVGTRDRNTINDFVLVEFAFFKIYEPGDRICSGLCPKGGDRFAVMLAEKYNTPKLWFPADWSLGKHAGFLRNTDIAENSDWLIACVKADRLGGTEDTIRKFNKMGKGNQLIIL